jgi:cytochrome b6-f complex subunit 7
LLNEAETWIADIPNFPVENLWRLGAWRETIADYNNFWDSVWKRNDMNAEIFNAAVLSFTLVMVGLGVGYLLLKLTPEE